MGDGKGSASSAASVAVREDGMGFSPGAPALGWRAHRELRARAGSLEPTSLMGGRVTRRHRRLAGLVVLAGVAGLAGPAAAAPPTDTTALQTAVKVGNDKSGI